jgi:hypothetical protein
MPSSDTPGNTPNNTGVTKFTLIVFIVCIILISIFIYDYFRIKALKSEIDKLDYNNIDFDKKLYDYINTHLKKTDLNIKDINENLTKTDLNIEKLNTVINSYINSSIQKNKLNEISLSKSSISQSSTNNINTYLQEYITANDEKLDAYILDTNARLDELTETNTIIMDSIININNKLIL